MLRALKSIIPSSIRRYVRERRRWRWFRGEFRTWSEAMSSSKGYADGAVLDRVVDATRQVITGQGLWDRDGHVFREKSLHRPLLEAFQKVSACLGAHFTVIDFGGGLGSTWRQHASQLSGLGLDLWCVVEQPEFVRAGYEFQNETLRFFGNLTEAFSAAPYHVVMLSSVLPYLEKPYEVLADVLKSDAEFLLLDRNPFVRDGRERLTVQHTPPFLGGGSYPCWLLSRHRVEAVITKRYELVMEWPGFDDLDPSAVQYHGTLYRKRHSSRSL
ncbi:MAG TPA: methyltransferase, TIGR04325 family [Opitutaceae bacterium]|nr:methyltransferase, TIGR04325 family [Opitutaceae bacterium]